MTCPDPKNSRLRLLSERVVVAVAADQAWPARLTESDAELHPRNRARHGLEEVFDGLDEARVPENCAGVVILFDGDAFEFRFHGAASSASRRTFALAPSRP